MIKVYLSSYIHTKGTCAHNMFPAFGAVLLQDKSPRCEQATCICDMLRYTKCISLWQRGFSCPWDMLYGNHVLGTQVTSHLCKAYCCLLVHVEGQIPSVNGVCEILIWGTCRGDFPTKSTSTSRATCPAGVNVALQVGDAHVPYTLP